MVGFAELVIGPAFGGTRWLNPPYTPRKRQAWGLVRPVTQVSGAVCPRSEGKQKGRRHVWPAVAGVSCGVVKNSLRHALLNMPLERISVEPHIHLRRQTLKKPSSECVIDRRAR
jgi:hypothetical protein